MTVVAAVPTRGRAALRPALARVRRRRPVRRSLVVVHRWSALVLGLFLVVITTSGAAVLYEQEWFHWRHAGLFHATASAHPLDATQALAAVHAQLPAYDAAWVHRDGPVWVVGDSGYLTEYAVDPGSGRITGFAQTTRGPMGFLVNLHECGLTCAGYPGYVPFLARDVPTGGITFLDDLTWGAVILGVLGVLLIGLAVSGLVTWWPGVRRIRQGFRLRMRRGRFARDYDLHLTLGALAVPFLLMWGVTGAAFEMPVVEKAWLAITGGSQPDPHRYDFTANPAPKDAALITPAQAAAAVTATHPGTVAYLTAATADVPYSYVSVAETGAYLPYGDRTGNLDAYVDGYDPTHVKIVDPGAQPTANRFYDEVLEPAHFGEMVGGWWRVVWFAFGLMPLLLMVTGISTWLVRRGTKKRRKRARAAA